MYLQFCCVLQGEWSIPERRPPTQWPENGVMNFTNYSTHYRPGLDLVLKGLTCDIHGGEKVSMRVYHSSEKNFITVGKLQPIASATKDLN